MFNYSIVSIALISHALAVVSPGPDFVMALKNSLTYSRKTGVYTAIGFGIGIGIHVLYSLLGLALLIKESPMLFNTIKYLGAIYLVYIGIQSLLDKSKSKTINNLIKKTDISSFKALQMGFLTNVLNPKASLFFLSLFTYIMESKPNVPTLTLISVLMMINTAIWFSMVAFFFNIPVIQKKYLQLQSVINKALGVLLILIALLIVIK